MGLRACVCSRVACVCRLDSQPPWGHDPFRALTKAEDKLPGHAEDNQGTSCSSARADESSQHLQRLSSKDPEIVQIVKDPCRDLTDSGFFRYLHTHGAHKRILAHMPSR